VFGCRGRSRKPWAKFICGKHWPLAGREQKKELRRLDREWRRSGEWGGPNARELWDAMMNEWDAIAAWIFDKENGLG